MNDLKFKVGDRVKVIDCAAVPEQDYRGRVGTVEAVDASGMAFRGMSVTVDIAGGENFAPEELELIEPEPVDTLTATDPATGGSKGKKPVELSHVAPEALAELGAVASMGAGKYDAYNYLKGFDWSLSYNALQRHLLAFWGGQDRDTESGRLHVAHAMWHCMCLAAFALRGIGTDDRPPAGPSA